MKKILFLFIFSFLFFMVSQGEAQSNSVNSFLPREAVFSLKIDVTTANILQLSWFLPNGYYLYRDHIRIEAINSPSSFSYSYQLPAGIPKTDPHLGNYEVYANNLNLKIRFQNPPLTQSFNIFYQGCAQSGFCYPPTKQVLTVFFDKKQGIQNWKLSTPSDQKSELPEENQVNFLWPWIIKLLSFYGIGILLSFTPCVLPMVPILLAIVLGPNQQHHPFKAATLALTYVLSMSFAYAGYGMIVATLGHNFQAFLQTPIILGLTAALFMVFAGGMFGWYEFNLPASWINKFNGMNLNVSRYGGSYIGVGIMGILATLILSPCITAPVFGILTYIAQTGNTTVGGLSLWTLSLGMGTPLLIAAFVGHRFLPKTGLWLNRVKQILGILLLLVALSLLSRLINPSLVTSSSLPLNFISVITVEEVQHQLKLAQQQRKAVLLDFYADWCINCKRLEHTVFKDPQIQKNLKHFKLLRADVTRYNLGTETLQKYYGVFAPPTLIFFDVHGEEIKNSRIVGMIKAKDFYQITQAITS